MSAAWGPDRPLAAPGLVSYRYRGRWGFIMIGATSNDDALVQAGRSLELVRESVDLSRLEIWDGERDCYVPVVKA